MLKTPENSLKPKPLYLFHPKIDDLEFIFIVKCDSEENSVWIKENNDPWKTVKVKIERERGRQSECTYIFEGDEGITLHLPYYFFSNSKFKPYVTSDYGLYASAKEVLLSEEKLGKLGITKIMELDLTNTPKTIADAEKIHRDAENVREANNLSPDPSRKHFIEYLFSEDRMKERETKFATKNSSRLSSSSLFDGTSLDHSEPGTSSASESLANEVTKLKM